MSYAIKTRLSECPCHWVCGTRTDCCPLQQAWTQFISLRQRGIRCKRDLFGYAMSGSGFLLGSLGWSPYKHFSPGSNQKDKKRQRSLSLWHFLKSVTNTKHLHGRKRLEHLIIQFSQPQTVSLVIPGCFPLLTGKSFWGNYLFWVKVITVSALQEYLWVMYLI